MAMTATLRHCKKNSEMYTWCAIKFSLRSINQTVADSVVFFVVVGGCGDAAIAVGCVCCHFCRLTSQPTQFSFESYVRITSTIDFVHGFFCVAFGFLFVSFPFEFGCNILDFSNILESMTMMSKTDQTKMYKFSANTQK